MTVQWLFGTHYVFNGEPIVHKMSFPTGRVSRTIIELGPRVAREWYPEAFAREEAS